MSTAFALVALLSWVVTAFVGFGLADRWVAGGRAAPVAGEAPEARIGVKRGITLGAHIAPAATSLFIWAAYVLVGGAALAWSAVGTMGAGIVFGAVLFALARSRRPVPRPVIAHAALACVTVVLAVAALLLHPA